MSADAERRTLSNARSAGIEPRSRLAYTPRRVWHPRGRAVGRHDTWPRCRTAADRSQTLDLPRRRASQQAYLSTTWPPPSVSADESSTIFEAATERLRAPLWVRSAKNLEW